MKWGEAERIRHRQAARFWAIMSLLTLIAIAALEQTLWPGGIP